MKITARLIVALVLGLALFGQAHATIKVVTSVGATASTILTPSSSTTVITIQNNGSGTVRLGFDGGTTNRAKSTPDPTSSIGYRLVAGASVTLTVPPGGFPQIRAILESGTTTTLDIGTNDPYAT